jgi:FkbM family methyltransferase
MNRTLSPFAQVAFSIAIKLQHLAHRANFPTRQFARAALKIANPLSGWAGKNRLVVAHLYGHDLVMPAEHPLASTLAAFPQYNRPLALASRAIADVGDASSPLVVIDVGANIGETIAIIEERCPGIGRYLCIEADQNIAELCRLNHKGNDRVQVKQAFIGENEGTAVWLEDDGRANPSTKLAGQAQAPDCDRLVRLDTIAAPFAATFATVSLIKVDTEGYDYSVMRSASGLLRQYKPAIYFEWYPKLLRELGELIWSGFENLESLGYDHFVFFTNMGDYHCAVERPNRLFLDSMAGIAEGDSIMYFDVFASASRKVGNRLVELSISQMHEGKMAQPIKHHQAGPPGLSS